MIVLGAACALAAVPAATGLALLERSYDGTSARSADVGWGVLGVGAVLGTVAALLLRRRMPLRPTWRAVLALWIALAVLALTDAALARIAPFRVGLLSLVLYLLPALLAATALHARRPAVMAALLMAAGVLPVAVAHPIALVQQHVGATQWMRAQGITSRQIIQRVDLSGLVQEPYQYDRSSGILTAIFHQDEGWLLPPVALAAETVTPGNEPCAPVLVAEGDAQDQQTPQNCEPSPDGVWDLDLGGGNAGVAREFGAVTVAMTGSEEMVPELDRALLAAQPADDAQMFIRIEPGPFTVTDWLVL
ncbi:MAG TPA: hypothetical protein VGS97_23010 [Actinocrinis sp.]|uniref:hypothetical protein n=1 Tax=Actinocrinis sp. TaxID=1920516 RepID=UPI002DDD53F4|nr:hypothetical protein [Actinocrinis sp.]HEV2346990.1 hypothetical protein [Actinocrinis sp.]